jgi:hypothetical protein
MRQPTVVVYRLSATRPVNTVGDRAFAPSEVRLTPSRGIAQVATVGRRTAGPPSP